MYFYICVTILLHKFHTIITEDAFDNDISQVHVSSIAEHFVNLFDEHMKENKKIRELTDKVAKIDSYCVDRDVYQKRMKLVFQLKKPNATNFYDALKGEDAFKDHRSETKSLYLKLKEKMNRDDILAILSERGKKKIKNYARRMMSEGYRPKKEKEMAIDEAVDKYLGELIVDDHSFDEERYSKYWDPEEEINDRLSKKSGRRLFKGERTSVTYYPFVVSIHLMGRFWCGGAIYWVDLVITSAACLQLMHNNRFFRENPKALQVRVGSNHSRIGGELVDALEVFFHPAYDPKTLRNNIAVVRLRRLLKFSYHRVPKMIEVSTQGQGVPFTATVIVLGWGVKKTNQKLEFEPIFLQSKQLPIYPNKFCQEVYGTKFVTSTMFCAGTLTTGEGACDHDAGGPAVLAGKLVGIISFGPSICGFPDAPTVFTLVGAYVDWIETVNETMPGYYRQRTHTTTTRAHPIVQFFPANTFNPDYTTEAPPVNWDLMKTKRTVQTINPVTTTQTRSPITTTTISSQTQPTAMTPFEALRATTEDLYVHLPPGAMERSKNTNSNESHKDFQVNPVIEDDGQVGMFVNARREGHKKKGKKRRGKKKKKH